MTEAMGHEYEVASRIPSMERGDAGRDPFKSRMRIGSLSQSTFSPRELVIETYKHLKESIIQYSRARPYC